MEMTYGYVRVSTREQNVERQVIEQWRFITKDIFADIKLCSPD